jgi:GTPase
MDNDWPEGHRSGVVAIIGRPNAGKSTLINHILGEKLAIVTAKPQTTRKRQLGIYTTDAVQILFTDTPGIHHGHRRLGDYMVRTAKEAMRDTDLVLWLIDALDFPSSEDTLIAETIQQMRLACPVAVVLNKMDIAQRAITEDEIREVAGEVPILRISALKGIGVPQLMEFVIDQLPEGPRYYPEDQLSDTNLRFIAAEIVREKIIELTSQEVPHAVAIEVTRFREYEDRAEIEATIWVERGTQQAILVGRGGSMIKQIGTLARQDLEASLDTHVRLDLRVKVKKSWRDDDAFLAKVGYGTPPRK